MVIGTLADGNGYHEEEKFIRLVASRYPILRALYPVRTFPFMELSVHSGVEKSNLSGYIKNLDEEGIVSVEQTKGPRSRSRSMISLMPDTRRLIECVTHLRGKRKSPNILQDTQILDKNIPLLEKKRIQSLVADHLVLISRGWKVQSKSKFYDFVGERILEEQFKPVVPTVLSALQNMIKYSNTDERSIIKGKVLEALLNIRDDTGEERSGIVAQNILDEFAWDEENYETLAGQYISNVEKGSEVIPFLRRRIVERFPERKTDLRDRLIELAADADESIIRRIENEFTQLH